MDRKQFEKKFPGDLVRTDRGAFAFVPDPLPPEIGVSREMNKLHSDSLIAIGGFRHLVTTTPNPEMITSPFWRREATLSSKIEGTKTEVEDLYLFEAQQKEFATLGENDNELILDTREVANYSDALRYGLGEMGNLPIVGRMIREMHKKLMKGVRGFDKLPGQYRKVQNFIGSSRNIELARFVPPPPELVENLMKDLETYINNPSQEIPDLAQVAIAHCQFETIHPFIDGNGRLGRILIPLMLADRGIIQKPLLYLSEYFERNRTEYQDRMLRVSTHNEWNEWIIFFLRGVEEISNDGILRARKIIDLREEIRTELQGVKRRSTNAIKLVDYLFQNPILTIKMAERFLKPITYVGARYIIKDMVKLGVLSVLPFKSGRQEFYRCDRIMEALR